MKASSVALTFMKIGSSTAPTKTQRNGSNEDVVDKLNTVGCIYPATSEEIKTAVKEGVITKQYMRKIIKE